MLIRLNKNISVIVNMRLKYANTFGNFLNKNF